MKNFFYYNSSNRRAIIALSIVIVAIHFFTKISEDKSISEYDFSQYQKEIKNFKNKKTVVEKKVKFSRSKQFHKKTNNIKPKLKNTIEVDINLADTLAFEQLPGIGTYFAKRICKYRNLLGGFYTKKQILEVYQMDSVRYEKIEKYLVVDDKGILKKNINEIGEYELRKHPYISSSLARLIVNYREEHGAYKSINELNNLHLIDTLKFRKIVNYFTTNEYNSFREEN